MNQRLACLFVLLAASAGCRACSDCYDYSSPVAPGPYSNRGRAGSVFADGTQVPANEAQQLVAVSKEQPAIDYSLAIEPASYEVPAGEVAVLNSLPPVAEEEATVAQPPMEKPKVEDTEPLPTVPVVMPPIPNEPTVTKLPPLFVQ